MESSDGDADADDEFTSAADEEVTIEGSTVVPDDELTESLRNEAASRKTLKLVD